MPTDTDSNATPARFRPDEPLLIDASRLIWRAWSGRLPTGIDRVCLAYGAHFSDRAQAVIQRKGLHFVLSPAESRRLFALLSVHGPRFRRRLVGLLARALPPAAFTMPRRGALYLNIGHTGLDSPALPAWIARHHLRAIYMIHDLIPIAAPEFCRAGEREKHVLRITNALSSATGFVTNSHATLDDLQRFATARNLPPATGTVAWLAGDALPVRPRPIARSPATRPYFVTIGTIEGRKNHILLLQVWQRLVARLGTAAPQLMIVGQRGWEADHALAMLDRCSELQGVVHELGRCDDATLADLVAGARALLMPSFVEGFGMPVIEALHVGTPVIASDLPVFREIAGDLPTYLAAFDSVGWERAILDFSAESTERARQIDAMPAYRAPTWASHFAVVEAYLAGLPTRTG